jgi:hypothetical protein
VHSFDVNFELLWLTKLSTAKVAEGTSSLRIGTTTVSSVHLEVVETQEKLSAILTLICSLSIVQLLRMLHDILLSKDSHPTYFTVIFSYRQTEAGIVKHRAVSAIVKGMIKAQVTSATVYEEH